MRARVCTALAAAAVLLAAGCGGDDEGGPAPAADGPLRGVCPDTVVVQTDWFAESEYGALYQLLGDDPEFDTAKKRVVGPLTDGGEPTGVNLEIRYGGAAIGNQQVSAQLYADTSITLGQVSTDEAIQNSKDLPTLAVVAPLEKSPYMIMWDRAKHPDVRTIADLGRDGTTVLHYSTDTYVQYLVGAGLLTAGQLDGSYDGSPSRWVASGGELAQTGFATSEPYIYKSELGNGKSYDVNLQLISDTGYPMYGQALAIRAAEKEKLAPCLEMLVPVVQRAAVAFAQDPAPTNKVVVEAVQADRNSVWTYTAGLAGFAVEAMKERGIVGNGSNATLGDFDEARMQRMIDVLEPIFARQDKPIADGLTPDALYTNEFTDPSIGL